MSPARLGLGVALLTLALDQASKLYLLFGYDLPFREPLQLGPFVSLVSVWNHGISYGLFQQDGEMGRWLLVAVSCVAMVAIGVWMWRAGNRLLGLSLGLIAGGAAGNAVDRAFFGAVYDFIQLHAAGYSWYVFNIADAAIVAGVGGLLYDAIFAGKTAPSRAVTGMPD